MNTSMNDQDGARPDRAPKKQINGVALRLAVFYGAIFLLVGVFLPWFPVWLKSRGLGEVEISLLLAAPLLIRIIFTPLISYLADRFEDRRRVLILLAWGSMLSLIAFWPLTSFWPLLIMSMIFGIFWTSVMPLTEAIAMTEVKLQGLDYGRMRLWGSLTFILASLAGGLFIDGFGQEVVLVLMLVAVILTILAAYGLPHDARNHRAEQQMKKGAPLPPIRWRDALKLARSPLFLLFLLSSSGVQATHAIYYSFGTLHWQSLSIAGGTIGALWAIGVIAEVTLFAWSKPLVRFFGPTKLLIIGALGAVLRWGLTALDPPLALLFPLQILHALTFGAAHLAAIHFIARAVPEKLSATGQGLYAAFAMGVVMGLMTTISGALYAALAGHAYFVMATLALLSLIGALDLHRRWNGERII